MNKLSMFILLALLCAGCSIKYPVLEHEAKVFRKVGNEVLFIFNEHEGKRTGYQWFRVDDPEEFKIGAIYQLGPKTQKETLK